MSRKPKKPKPAIFGAYSMTPNASGQITSPVPHIDIPLPAGSDGFRIEFNRLVASANDIVSFRFSVDGGASFIGQDSETFEEYQSLTHDFAIPENDPVERNHAFDSQGYLSYRSSADLFLPMRIWAFVEPGESDINARVSAWGEVNQGGVRSFRSSSWLGVGHGRVNVMRIGMYFDGGKVFTNGQWRRYDIPALA